MTLDLAQFADGCKNSLTSIRGISGRPISVTNEENTETVAQILKKDRRFTCEEIAHETSVSCSSVHTILTEWLSMRKTVARWVPHFLSKTEKQ